MKRSIILIPALIALVSCGGSENRGNKDTGGVQASNQTPEAVTTTTPVVTSPVPADTTPRDNTRTSGQTTPQNDETQSRVVVSFISRGEGIDKKLRTDFDAWLANKKNVSWETHPWGREGEVNYCFALTNLSAAEQTTFAGEVRKFFAGRQMD